jgi:hypothetical protein
MNGLLRLVEHAGQAGLAEAQALANRAELTARHRLDGW